MENNKQKEFNFLIINGGVYEIKGKCQEYCKNHPLIHCFFVEGKNFNKEDINPLKDIKIDMVCCPSFFAEHIPFVIQNFPSIKWVHSFSAGVENFFKAGSFKGNEDIIFSNSKGVASDAFGEGAIASIMYFNYNIPSYIEGMNNKDNKRLSNRMLEKKTLLIIGYGNNGIALAKRAKFAFNMKIIGVVRTIRDNISGKEYTDEIYSSNNLPDEVITKADFVFSTLPSTKETIGIFDKNFFQKMNKDAIFLNIGRGNAVIEDDLIYALENNLIRGAALDVTQEEPRSKNSKLYNIPPSKLLLTNHSIGVLQNHIHNAYDCLIQNIENYLQKGKPLTLVDMNKFY